MPSKPSATMRMRDATLPVPRARLRVEVHETAGDLDDVWDDFERHGHCTAFQTRAWVESWFDTVGRAQKVAPLDVLVREEGSGRPVMLLPLCRTRRASLRVIECAGGQVTDYQGPLFARGFSPSGATALQLRREIAARLGGDLIAFDRMPEKIAGAPNPLCGIFRSRPVTYSSWMVSLPATKEAFEAISLDRSFLKELRRKGRRVRGNGSTRVIEALTPADRDRVFAALCEQRGRRFAELDRFNILADAAHLSFYRRAIHHPRSNCRLFALEVDGEIIATAMGPSHGGQFHLILSTIAEGRWKSSSPGNVLIDEMITLLIAQGTTHFDFTIGDEPYKRNFGAQPQPIHAAHQALSLRGLPRAAVESAKGLVRQMRVNRMAPERPALPSAAE